MKLTILSVGARLSGPEKELFERFAKRISQTCSIELQTVEPKRSASDTDGQIKLESELIQTKLEKDDYVILLDETGSKFNNIELAERFNSLMSSGGYRRLVFVIGGAYGVSAEVRAVADMILSFSDQVFPHQLFRVMLAEQIYRSLSIFNNSPYHHK